MTESRVQLPTDLVDLLDVYGFDTSGVERVDLPTDDEHRRVATSTIETMLDVVARAYTDGREQGRRETLHALAFAASVIKSGEPWTDECERIIGGALAHKDTP